MYLKHNLTKTRLYNIWAHMKQRCYNPKNSRYEQYHGRGITVCDDWLNDFMCFRKWAMGSGYSENLTLDRIDNDKGYSPDNCRWATKTTQNNNRTFNHRVTLNGVSKTISEWSLELGIPWTTIYGRLERGLSPERALRCSHAS